MRRYETIFIVDPDVSEEQRGLVFEKLSDLMSQKDGLQIKVNEWGSKKLAYVIKKKFRGYYILLEYCGNGALVDEIERFFRIDDRILKFMTVVIDADVDLEKVKQEIADAEAKAAEAAEAEKARALEASQKAVEASQKATQSEKPVTKPEPEAAADSATKTEETTEEA
ncbi:MAG: 30S ribosomal protein S6 [Deltaproteobacteria bacterium]|nr:30S ribosomal protein S6 [Deltaproteobacteria bacterium]